MRAGARRAAPQPAPPPPPAHHRLPLPPLAALTAASAAAYAEFSKIAQATSVGFFIMGFIGFFVKLIFIPINNIIVGMG